MGFLRRCEELVSAGKAAERKSRGCEDPIKIGV
jgi:hypothetical protein